MTWKTKKGSQREELEVFKPYFDTYLTVEDKNAIKVLRMTKTFILVELVTEAEGWRYF